MNLSHLRHRLTVAIRAAEKEREKAEREHHPATRDREYGKVLMGREILAMLDEEEAK